MCYARWECGGIGIRSGLKIRLLRDCGFESHHSYQFSLGAACTPSLLIEGPTNVTPFDTSLSLDEILIQHVDEMKSFSDYLAACAGQVGVMINSFIPHSDVHEDINRYLYDPLTKYSENAGKRHRPLICIAACVAVGGDADKVASSAAALEHFHTAALIHDDIADEAETRRGEPCLHLTQGLGLAINEGDLGLSLVNGTVMHDPTLDDATKVRVVTELVDMTRRTIEGQALDLCWARDARYDITEDDYLLMATLKTAHYSGAVPLAVGAIIGGGSEEQIAALRQYGLDTGLAFQIQDDLLNLVGVEEATKKDFRSDITEGKRTLCAVHALSHSDKADRLAEILSARTTDRALLDEAVEIMQECGSIDYARAYALNLTSKSKSRMIEVLPESKARDLLVSMADWFVSRLY